MRRLLVICLAATALTGLTACEPDRPTENSGNVVVPVPDPAPSGDPSVCNGEKPIKYEDGRWVCP